MFEINALSGDVICSPLTNQLFDYPLVKSEYLEGLDFVDDRSHWNENVDPSIASDFYWFCITGYIKFENIGKPVVEDTHFEWFLNVLFKKKQNFVARVNFARRTINFSWVFASQNKVTEFFGLWNFRC